MRHLIVINLVTKEGGFSLFELIIVFIIMGIVSAVGAPSLIESQRQERVKEAFSKIRGALVEAQLNANRMSQDCSVQITNSISSYQINGSPPGCVLESIKVDKRIVSITKTNFSSLPNFANGSSSGIDYEYKGTTVDSGTLWIAQRDFSGNIIPSSAKCIVISSIGMIRTGIFSGTPLSPVCDNVENKRYDNANP